MYSYKNKPKPPQPGWMKYGLLLFLGYAIFVGYDKSKDPEANPNLDLNNYPALQDFMSVTRWNQIIDPSYGKEITYSDRVIGEKDIAACGQEVTVTIEAIEQPDVTLPEDFVVPDEPITFRIGDGTQHVVWDRGVRGMREKGERRLLIGAQLIDPTIEKPDAPKPGFILRVQSIVPNTAGPSIETERLRDGVGVPVSCGDRIQFTFRILNEAGEQQFLLDPPETIRVGDSVFGVGMDRALIGLRPNGMRRATIPPDYFPTDRDDIPFPSDQNAIVELIPLPYKEEQIGEPTDESDSEPTERH